MPAGKQRGLMELMTTGTWIDPVHLSTHAMLREGSLGPYAWRGGVRD